MKTLPDNVLPYRRTATFTEQTLPAALRRAHATKAGVWGLIHIVSGRLRYEITATGEVQEIGPDDPPAVIEPEVLHNVTPLGPVQFYVEFHRQN